MYTIEDLREGKVAVVNDGTPEELNEILNWENKVVGVCKYYWNNNGMGVSSDSEPDIPIPTQSVKDFLNQEEEFRCKAEQLVITGWVDNDE